MARETEGVEHEVIPGASRVDVATLGIVVEKLTKNVNENHLREIFGSYGPIKDLDLPMNKQFMTNRGTAYILYANTTDAEAAIAHMHEAQLDGAIINPEEADHHSTASMGVDLHLDLTVEELLPAATQDHRQDDTDRHHRQDAPLPLGDMDVDQIILITVSESYTSTGWSRIPDKGDAAARAWRRQTKKKSELFKLLELQRS
ncbi:MAG: hypothetical protein Q9186_005129 [Xanthomendoza sp. 1 TL-2023]